MTATVLLLATLAGDGEEFFENSIRPLLVEQCLRCHGEEKPKAGLRLDSRAALLAGGRSGAAAVVGDPEASLLVQAVRRSEELAMPPKSALAPEQVAALEQWVALGLPWPEERVAPRVVEKELTAEQRAWWAFAPLAEAPPPAVRARDWPTSELDAFVLAKLEERGLAPAPPAERRAWLRRVTLDLTGLPPTQDEVAAFVADPEPDAFSRVVDRLLASPAYGERAARQWLDVVRYTDLFDARSLGGADDDPGDVRQAWRYRDWVVDAFARDLPFSDFVQDQLAGDLRASDGGAFDARRLVATGVLAIGDWGGGDADKEKLLTDIADDQVNLVGRAFLGLTLGCARCHDHKFDPLSQADYYALAGIFFSSHILPDVGPKTAGPPMLRLPLASSEELAQRAAQAARTDELLAALNEGLGGAPLATPIAAVGGLAEVAGLRGGAELPAATVNGGAETLRFATVTLPGRSVSVHPAPGEPVAIVFTAAAPLRLALRGSLADGDAVCGDGIAWTLARRRHAAGAPALREALARGEFENGGRSDFGDAVELSAVELAAGDELLLEVAPRGDHICDTTLVEWSLADLDRPRQFELAAATLAALEGGLLAAPIAAGDGAQFRFVGAGSGPLDAAARERAAADVALAPLLAELRDLEARAFPPLAYAHGIAEGGVPGSPHAGVHDVALHERGRYDRLGPLVARRFPRVLAGEQPPPAFTGSGRRELAQWLVDPMLPLVARVAVNRLWQHHFGTGLVATSGNFGRLGEAPSHPELLDWLARRFIESGGSSKALHRAIVLSSTYRQAAATDAATLAADPENRLLARFPRRRLDAEQLRDALLMASGELDRTLGGPAVRDPATKRRALYLATIRSDRSNYRALFDAADPTSIVDRRHESTVAPQALWLMNDPFVLERAAALARSVEAAAASGGAAPVDALYERLFARPPDDAERALADRFLADGSLEEFAHVLLMSNEFAWTD
ncbi:MAG: PSD1 domain-containing protein [Planctomycetes bacterium]|nr:PSD1 domain-containing protein [Planctomycetota bacterium]